MTLDKSPDSIHTMFNMIAGNYDKINDIMSFGTHKIAKFMSIKNLDIKPYDNVIDLCCGTGDLSRMIKKIQPDACVTGIDFSERMLEIAKDKNRNEQKRVTDQNIKSSFNIGGKDKNGNEQKRVTDQNIKSLFNIGGKDKNQGIRYLKGDVTNLPYEDNSFDIAIMGFGLRNIQNAEKAVEEVYRILRPNGQFLHLDFGRKNLVSKIYDKIFPILIKNFTENHSAYRYLIKSKEIFPEPADLIKDFESKGFKLKKREDYLFGVISSQIMVK